MVSFIKNLFIGKKIRENAYQFGVYKKVNNKIDYQYLINEMNEISARYEKMPSNEWKLDELRSYIDKYEIEIKDYLDDCKKITNNKKVLSKLHESLLRLSYILFSADKESIHTCFNSLAKDIKATYYKQRTRQLCEIIANNFTNKKFTFELEDPSDIIITGQTHYLFDIYNKYYSCFPLEIKDNKDNFDKKTADNGINYRIYNYLIDIYKKDNKDGLKSWYLMDDEIDNITLEELFYFVKCLDIDEASFLNGLNDEKYKVSSWYQTNPGLCPTVKELLVKSYFDYLDKQYDKRIMVIPRFVSISGVSEEKFAKRHNQLKEYKALYITSYHQLDNAKYYFDTYKSMKRVFIKDSVIRRFKRESYHQYDDAALCYARRFGNRTTLEYYNELKQYDARDIRVANGSVGVNLIPVSDDANMSELTEYLNDNPKILKK